jgi:PrtD family type I secretion system ABC transporter
VETLILLTVLVGFAFLVLGGLETARGRVFNRLGAWLEETLTPELIRAGLARRLAGEPVGAQALRDLGQVRSFVGGQGIQPLVDAPWVPIFIAVIWLLHPWLGMLALAAAVLLFAVAVANELTTRAPLREANRRSVEAQGGVEAALRNADVVHAMGLLPALTARWHKASARALEGQERAGDRGSLLVGTSRFVRLFVQSAILGLGAFLVIRGELTAGAMIAGSILLGRALAPVEQAIGAWKQMIAARVAHARLQALLRAAPAPAPAMDLPPPTGRLTVDRATLLAPGARRGETPPILRNVSFELTPGDVLGVVGPSASGKTTLCRLIVGIWRPSAGHVRLDSAEVHAWDRAALGAHIGYLPQDVELFGGTVRDNIARLGAADDTAVIAAAKLAGVHDMILHLPDGYNTPVGEAGAVLSAGQRQRVGLARALFGRPRLVVLDEPNANLDAEGEAALLDAVAAVKAQGTTVVLVAHRMGTLAHADKLLLMRDGAVEAFGPRDAVLARLKGPRPVEAPAARTETPPAAEPATQPATG